MSIKHASQLYCYFAATDARLALLTNGVVYRFFTDAEKANMIDDRPFFTFDLDNYKASDLRTLATFQRADFDLARIVSHAGALKLQSEVLAELRKEFDEPSGDLVKIIAGRLHDGIITRAVRSRFRSAITQAYGSLIRDGVHQRLEKAISGGSDEPDHEIAEVDQDAPTFEIVLA